MTKLQVPMPVELAHAWLTWVRATTGCLRALGVACDQADVAGYSGYAFVLNIHAELCPSGPTSWETGLLLRGIPCLGRAPLCYNPDLMLPADEANCRAAFDIVAREVEAGRPCVIWGAYLAEFAIATGIEDGHYLVQSITSTWGQAQTPVPLTGLDAPGGPYVLAFPAPTTFAQRNADRCALLQALRMLHLHSGCPVDIPHWNRTGQAGYDAWISALQAGHGGGFGNRYNAACWSEARRLAHEFLARLAGRNPDVAGPLGRAAAAMNQVAESLAQVSALYPMPSDPEPVEEAGRSAQAVQALHGAQAAEAEAAAALAEAAAAWPRS